MFTIIAKDNIDQNSKSTTAKKHYHGTSMSVFLFPTISNPGEQISIPKTIDEVESDTPVSTSKKISSLPSSYTYIRNFLTSVKNLFAKNSVTVSPSCDDKERSDAIDEEIQWLDSAANTPDLFTPWSRHHSFQKRSNVRTCDISAILPLLDEPVHTLDMQYHLMVIIQKMIQILNPGQIAVDVCDQPIFALTKELMMRFWELFGDGKYFCVFGSLHIEKSLLIINE